MIYNIYYCVSNDKCFGWPADQELKNVFGNNGKDFMPEILAMYDSDTDSLEMEDQYFNWYDARDDWDEEINKVIQEIINSPVVWYCLIHGDCHITDRFVTPTDPCFTTPPYPGTYRNFCICEQIATCHGDQIVSNVGDLRKYFDDAADGYTLEHLDQTLTFHNVSTLCI